MLIEQSIFVLSEPPFGDKLPSILLAFIKSYPLSASGLPLSFWQCKLSYKRSHSALPLGMLSLYSLSQPHLFKECDLELAPGCPGEQGMPCLVLPQEPRQAMRHLEPPWIAKNEIPTYFLCCRYPDMSRRVFRGKDRKSFCTCCFHDNNLFFCVSVNACKNKQDFLMGDATWH